MANFIICLRNLVSEINSRCIFQEGEKIALVQLKSLVINDNMLTLTLVPITAIGFANHPPAEFKIECVFEYLSFRKNTLIASILGWKLLAGKANVNRLVKFALSLPDSHSFLEEIRKIH